jgi:hypothetical protein
MANHILRAPAIQPARHGLKHATACAVPFDASSAQVSGDVFPLADGVGLTSNGIRPEKDPPSGPERHDSGCV